MAKGLLVISHRSIYIVQPPVRVHSVDTRLRKLKQPNRLNAYCQSVADGYRAALSKHLVCASSYVAPPIPTFSLVSAAI